MSAVTQTLAQPQAQTDTQSGKKLLSALANRRLALQSLSKAEIKAICKHCAAYVETAQSKIGALLQRGDDKGARTEQARLIASLPARLSAALKAAGSKKHRRRPVPLQDIWTAAEGLGVIDRPATPTLRRKEKGDSGTYRLICSFDFEDVARQHLAVMALKPFADRVLLPVQYGLQGGRPAVCEKLLQNLAQASLDTWVIQADVTDYFGSISHRWLEENLPLPKGMISSVILTSRMRFSSTGSGLARPTSEVIDKLKTRGIPQGSAASPFVAEFVMAHILRGIADHPEIEGLVNYSDNIVVLPASPERTTAGHPAAWGPDFGGTLRDTFAAHPAGHIDTGPGFHLKVSAARLSDRPGRIMGYDFTNQGGPQLYVREQDREKRLTFHRASWYDAAWQLEGQALLNKQQRIVGKVAGYGGAFSHCAATVSECAKLLAEFAEQRCLSGGSGEPRAQ